MLCWKYDCKEHHVQMVPSPTQARSPAPHLLPWESGASHLEPAAFGFRARVHASDVNAQAVLCSPADREAQGPAIPQYQVHLQEGQEIAFEGLKGTANFGGSWLQGPSQALKGN